MYRKLLKGKRFEDDSNEHYILPLSMLPKRVNKLDGTDENVEDIDFHNEEFLNEVTKLITHHEKNQVPRLKTLRRYYDADNDIKYQPPKAEGRADNRIASGLAQFNVDFKQGVVIGNPVTYTVEDDELSKLIEETAKRINEDYHNKMMTTDFLIYGRAYEIVYNQDKGKVKKLSPYNTFVIYDDSADMNSICGVHWYTSEFAGRKEIHVHIYANDDFEYHLTGASLSDLSEPEAEQNYFEGVQINEWMNGEDRKSDYERVMDIMDAYDISISEMANFQQDSSNAYLVIEGNPDTGMELDTEGMTESEAISAKRAFEDLQQGMSDARMLVLGDRKFYGEGEQGVPPKAYYLKKEYDVAGVESYNDRLMADYLRYTSLVDFTDENMGSNQSGVSMRFKGWSSDNDRRIKERVIEKALMRRWRLLATYWAKTANGSTDDYYEAINKMTIKFTPNVPQSDKEIMEIISGMVGIISNETITEMSSKLTGVASNLELNRIATEGISPQATDEERSFLLGEQDENSE